jgi:two-component system sensor histidine kinase CpxA
MQSLFPKILLSSFLTVICAGIAIAVPVSSMMIPGGGGPLATPVVATLAAATAAVICFLLTRHITSPLLELRRGAGSIAAGHLAVRVPANLRDRRDEIGQLGRDFDRMADRLESLVDSHKRLLGDVSHELRSPLSRLTVALGLARRAAPEQSTELLDRIALEAKRLDDLIGQLLSLSRIESGMYGSVPTAVDLIALVHEVAADADFEARAQHKRVNVTALDVCTVVGSEELLRSAVENVVRNAVRHTREEETVDVSVRRDRESAFIRVRDYGPGVAEDMLSDIFLPFRRVQAGHADQSEGFGLGLAIAQRAVAAVGGRIHATNAADGGLVIDIELPLNSRR